MEAKRYSNIALPVVLFTVAGTYGYWVSQSQLVSSRPVTSQYNVPDPVPVPGVETVHSLIWEDPLSASYESWRKLPETERSPHYEPVQDSDLDERMLADAAARTLAARRAAATHPQSPVPPPSPAAEWPVTVGGGGDSPDQLASDARRYLDMSPAARRRRHAMKLFVKSLVGGETICLPVFVPGGPYADDSEKRMRTRYAVVSALAESGYALKYNRRMSYVAPEVCVRTLRGWQTRQVVVPVKLYRHGTEDRPQVLVLWINESELGLRPLLATHRILHELFEEADPSTTSEKLSVSIVGPATSETLDWMGQEIGDMTAAADACRQAERGADTIAKIAAGLDERAQQWLAASSPPHRGRIQGFTPLLSPAADGIHVFSPRATKDFGDAPVFQDNSLIKLHRVVGTDTQLAAALYEELKLRGAAPGHVVLITEHDTAYGRAIPKTMENALSEFDDEILPIFRRSKCLQCHGPSDEDRRGNLRLDRREFAMRVVRPGRPADSRLLDKLRQRDSAEHAVGDAELRRIRQWVEKDATRISTFYILRGIDGRLPGDEAEPRQPAQQSDPRSSAETPTIVERAPEGRSQYDYLRRLVDRIERLENVTAIGVVGSDVYDKLLVMRALKPHFPNCVFFTTDLDAIYKHPNERQHTRNLVVASHFGLSLGKQLQRSTPPFRDSYQTATFLAAGLAIHRKNPQYTGGPEPDDEAVIDRAWQLMFQRCLRQHAEAQAGAADVEQSSGDPAGRKAGAGDDRQDGSAPDDDSQLAAALAPVVYVIGRTEAHAMTNFHSQDQKRRAEALIHGADLKCTNAWYYVFACGIAVVAAGIGWLTVRRDYFRKSPLLQRELGSDVFRGGAALGAIGAVLAAVALVRGYVGAETASFADGYSTWPIKVVYALTGAAAVLSLAFLIDQFKLRIADAARLHPQVAKLAGRCFQRRQVLQIAILAAAVLCVGGMIAYPPAYPGFWVPAAAIAGGLALAWRRCRRPDDDLSDSLLLSGDCRTLAKFALLAILGLAALNVAVAMLAHSGAAPLSEPLSGWHIASTSRGVLSRVCDWFATLYAFAMVSLLLSSFFFFHFWFRELSRQILQPAAAGPRGEGPAAGEQQDAADDDAEDNAEDNAGDDAEDNADDEAEDEDLLQRPAEWGGKDGEHDQAEAKAPPQDDAKDDDAKDDDQRDEDLSQRPAEWNEDGEHEQAAAEPPPPLASDYDRLWIVGQLSQVTAKKAPVLMGLLLVMVTAYHPWMSPVPMPASLLVLTTLSMGLFLVSTLTLRWHFEKQRRDATAALDEELSQLAERGAEERPQQERKEQMQQLLKPVEDNRDPTTTQGGTVETATVQDVTLRALMLLDVLRAEQDESQRREALLNRRRQQIADLSEGVFQPWDRSPVGWLLGGGATLALVDLWIRWWTIGG